MARRGGGTDCPDPAFRMTGPTIQPDANLPRKSSNNVKFCNRICAPAPFM